MIFNEKISLFFLSVSIVCSSQANVCEGSPNNFSEFNTIIGKCAIEKFKKSKTQEFVSVPTLNRFGRKKNSYLTNLKKNLSTSPTKLEATKKNSKVKRKVKKNVNGLVKKKPLTIYKEEPSEVLMRFDQVTDMPVFTDCSGYSLSEKEVCVKEVFVDTILDNFIYPIDAASQGLEGRVWIRFIINTEGYVKKVTATGPENGRLLEGEAKRLIMLLPKFIPGKHNGEYVNVEYFLPIDFQLNK